MDVVDMFGAPVLLPGCGKPSCRSRAAAAGKKKIKKKKLSGLSLKGWGSLPTEPAMSVTPFNKSNFAQETMVMGSDAAAVDVYVHPALGKIEQVDPLMLLAGFCGCNQHVAGKKFKVVMDKEETLKQVRWRGCGSPFILVGKKRALMFLLFVVEMDVVDMFDATRLWLQWLSCFGGMGKVALMFSLISKRALM